MRRITITLCPDEREALWRLAESELRHPRDQIHLLLREGLDRRGLLKSADDVSQGQKALIQGDAGERL